MPRVCRVKATGGMGMLIQAQMAVRAANRLARTIFLTFRIKKPPI
jgi:hypothetical protein